MGKINILHISPDFDYSCGVSKHINDLSRYYSSNDKYKLFFITNKGNSLIRLREQGVPIKFIKFSKGFINIFFLLPNVYTLLVFCYKNKIDIIHTHHRYPELLGVIAGKILGIKTLSTVHSLLKGHRHLSFKSDRIIAVSKSVASLLTNYFRVPSKKMIMLYNCMEINNSELLQLPNTLIKKLNLTDSDKVLLFLGKIIPEKGVGVLIEAFKKISKERRDLKLLIIGDFYDRSYEISLRKEPAGIIFLPSVQNPFPFYYIADIVIVPSMEEALSYVMLESGIMKKPFIGSSTGGINEFIEDGISGLLFQPNNAGKLAEKINVFLDNPGEAKIMGENLYKKVINECSCSNYFQKLNGIYDELSG